MKVAMVCPYDLGRFGGVQDQAMRLTSWLNARGHDVWLVGPGEEGPPGSRLVGPATVVSANGSAAPISLSASAWRATSEAVEGADIVHVHEPFMPVVAQAATVGPAAKVGTFHADPSAGIRRFYRAAGPVLRRVANRLEVTTAVSPVAASALRGIVEPILIPNGIDVSAYGGEDKDPFGVAFVGRDDARKGLSVLLEAWTAVRASVPEATLTVIGADGRDHDGITFVGRVEEGAKRLLLARAAVFCAPNTGGESFGITVAEGLASGCAVVASGLPAFVHVAGDAAAYVAPGDVAGLAETLASVLSDESRRAGLSTAALERARRYDFDAVAARYLAAYEGALGA